MYWQPVLFGLACAGAIVCAARSRSISASLLAWLMVSVWAGANLLWLADQTAFLPLLTLPVAVAGYAFWYDGRQRWQAWFASIMATRLGLHVVYPGSGAIGELAYLHLINLTFFAALVAISWKGGISDAVGAIGRYGGLLRLHRCLPTVARASGSSVAA